ncbi:MAG: nucleotide exchange factor GrpE [Ktedonobacteraceae bacterium]|nr:nucleotide exchange factor GrpE [Ktedonobacteraceae bacterium]
MMEEPQEMSGAEQQAKDNVEQPTTQPSPEVMKIAELEMQLNKARQEAADNWNKYLRERADVDNIRKRQERVITDRVQNQKKAIFNKLLDVIDNVERALLYQETMDKQQLQQTLRMFHWQMNEVMRSEGINAVATVGETFNPYLHEAIEAVEDSDQPEGTIIEEARKGYTLGDETLRPARVKVSMGNK